MLIAKQCNISFYFQIRHSSDLSNKIIATPPVVQEAEQLPEMIASLTAINLIDKALRLTNEAVLFGEAEIDIQSLKSELEDLKHLVISIDKTKWNIGEWLMDATKAAQRTKFILGMYVLQTAGHQHRRGSNNMVLREGDNPIKKLNPGDVASEIQRIIKAIQVMKNWGLDEGFFLLPGGSRMRRSDFSLIGHSTIVGFEEGLRRSNDLRFMENSYSFIEEEELVGIKSQKEELVSLLVGEPSKRLVISLVGLGGVGKTTLARVIYQSKEFQQHFDFHAWINVPQSYHLKDLFVHLVKTIREDGDYGEEELDTMEEQELISRLKKHLLTKRYVIVFDDVWQVDFWEAMNHVFPDSNNGSRIIVTTRNNATAASCDVFKCLQPLSKEMACELFCKHAFGNSDSGNHPHDLSELAREINGRCHGFPLVIKAIADYLSTGSSDWTMMLNHFHDGFRLSPRLNSVISTIFSRSYNDLPFPIRLCFLYFGIFPADFLIPDQKLFMLWIAEGFVKEEVGKTLEQVAEIYLNELINRNLVQVLPMKYDGTERTCTVQGFMHEILVANAKEIEICRVFEERDWTANVEPESRRLSIYGGVINSLEITVDLSRVHSAFVFDANEIVITKSSLVSLFERFKLLELLDFENAPIDDLPTELGNLLFLKYLSLRNTKVKKLPKSIALLLNLQTLDTRNTLINELPIEIQKLRKLRHILASVHNGKGSCSVRGTRIKEGIRYLENLQTLMTVEARSSGFGVIKELKKLRKLRCLAISQLDTHIVNSLCTSIEKMNLLKTLSLYASDDRQTLVLESISTPPPLLRRLILKGRLKKLPGWILRLQNLSILGLSFSRLTIDPLEALSCLPNLESLLLHRAYDGEQLHFAEGSFEKLKQLVLTELRELRVITIERGALPNLEALTIGPSPLLNEVPSGIEHLRNLKALANYDMPTEFVSNMQPDGGSDYSKVQHVSSVIFFYRVQGRSYISLTLGESELLDYLQGLPTNRDAVVQHDLQSSLFFSDREEESASPSTVQQNDVNRLSFSSDRFSFFSDDIED